MMKTIFLVRHAKSSWEESGLNDQERPLKKRGILDARHKAKAIALKKSAIDLILTSPAFRALNTAILFSKYLNYPLHKIGVNEAIYNSNVQRLLEVVHSIDNSDSSVMIFGHDPSLALFASYLTGKTFEKIPTSGVVCIDFAIADWKKIKKKSGKLKFKDFSKALK